jgi:two-component system, sensor histidine kinase and response regulator
MVKKVLSVDDDAMIRDLVKQILEAEGFLVESAENGQLGLSKLEQDGFNQDLALIVLDVSMPIMSGLELLATLKERNLAPDVPVIMLTGEAKHEDMLKGYNLGADYYITKPFTRLQLKHGLELVLNE